jgi:hypothetical protein
MVRFRLVSADFETLAIPSQTPPKAALDVSRNVGLQLERICDCYSPRKVFSHENVTQGPIFKLWSSMLISCEVMLLCCVIALPKLHVERKMFAVVVDAACFERGDAGRWADLCQFLSGAPITLTSDALALSASY